jgi:hypothetical protein
MTTDNKRPWPVIVIASLYLLVGVVGFIAHFPELWARHPDAVAIELTELLVPSAALGSFYGRGGRDGWLWRGYCSTWVSACFTRLGNWPCMRLFAF